MRNEPHLDPAPAYYLSPLESTGGPALLVTRGLPGVGKSTLGKALVERLDA